MLGQSYISKIRKLPPSVSLQSLRERMVLLGPNGAGCREGEGGSPCQQCGPEQQVGSRRSSPFSCPLAKVRQQLGSGDTGPRGRGG